VAGLIGLLGLVLAVAVLAAPQSIQVPFVENEGQFPRDVGFAAKVLGGSVAVTHDGRIITSRPATAGAADGAGPTITESLVGAQVQAVCGLQPARAKVNYFQGADPDRWIRGASTYRSLSLGHVYDGIEIQLQAAANNVEKIFIVEPGSVPGAIDVRIEGAGSLAIASDGRLLVETAAGPVAFTAPIAYQMRHGRREPVEVAYTVNGHRYGFEVGDYDPDCQLVIDPLLAGTYLGGTGSDGWSDLSVAVDDLGRVFVAASAASNNLPTTDGVVQESSGGGWDLCVARFDADLTTLEACTYLGGVLNDAEWPGVDMALAPDGSVYVTSTSRSPNYPVTPGAYSETITGNYDIVISHLNADLNDLLGSTFIGGTSREEYPVVTVAADGRLFMSCESSSSNFPVTAGVYQEARAGGKDMVICILSSDLTTLLGSTYLGGSADDWPEVILLDETGDIHLTGWTRSGTFPVSDDAYQQTSAGTYHSFVSRMSGDLTALEASTYFGGSNWEFGYDLALAPDGSVFMCGHTASNNLPVTDGAVQGFYQGSGGAGSGDDIFIVRFDHDLTSVLACTYLGGTAWENGVALLADGDQSIYLGAITSSDDFPVTSGAFATTSSGGSSQYAADMIIARLDLDLSTMLACTYLGGNGTDNLGGMAMASDGSLYIAGATSSNNFPTGPGAFDTTYDGGSFDWGGDVVITRLDADLSDDSVAAIENQVPATAVRLVGVSPNPFNPRTEVAFVTGETLNVRVVVHDMAGRRVAVLADRVFAAGEHVLAWDGRDQRGLSAAAGTYLLSLEAGEVRRSLKLMLVK